MPAVKAQPAPAPQKGALNVAEAAAYVGINKFYLTRLVLNGEGPRVVRLGRRKLFRIPDLDAWLESRTCDAG